jgi:hypothetical protein
VIKDISAIPNFFQPRPCLDTTVFPDYYSVNSYCDSVMKWLDYIEIDKETEIVTHDFFYKFRGERYTYAQVSVQFRAPTRIDCDSRVDTSFNLNFWFILSKQTYTTESGESAPLQYKIRFLEIQPLGGFDTIPPPQYQNRWSFLNFGVHGGPGSASFKPIYDGFDNLSIEPGMNYGVMASFTLFASDTFTVFDKTRLWEYGLDLGVGYDHMGWNWKLDDYSHTGANQTVSPLNSMACNYDLLTEIDGVEEEVSLDILSVPLSFTLKRYFSPRKVNSVMLKAGVSFNYLLGSSTEITSGTISYTGLDCSFQDPQSGTWIEGITIDDLPYYGFGTFDASLTDGTGEVYAPYYLAAHAKLAFDLRKDNYARLHWIIAPYFNYAVTDLNDASAYAIEPGGRMTDLSAAASPLKPFSFGLEVGIAYNIIPNGLKNVKAKK